MTNYTLIQEELRAEGSPHWRFWLLVACVLMNVAPGKRARPRLPGTDGDGVTR